MATSKNSTKSKKPKSSSVDNKSRTLKPASRIKFRTRRKMAKASQKPLPGIWRLYSLVFRLLRENKVLFFGILFIHAILSLFFVTGFGLPTDFANIKTQFDDALNGQGSTISTSLTLFGVLLATGNTPSSESGNVYQLFLTVIISLVLIWAIRQRYAGEKVSIKQCFYSGTYPLVQFVLVIFVIGIQLIPFLIGNFVFVTVITNGLAVTLFERLVWFGIFMLLALVSLYFVLSSIFSLYIVTLPDMTPLRALRSARGLVRYRRLSIFIRILGIPILAFFIFCILLLPLIYFVPALAAALFILLLSLMLYIFHSYMYNLYRSML